MKLSKVLRSGVSVVLVFVCILGCIPFASFAASDFNLFDFPVSGFSNLTSGNNIYLGDKYYIFPHASSGISSTGYFAFNSLHDYVFILPFVIDSGFISFNWSGPFSSFSGSYVFEFYDNNTSLLGSVSIPPYSSLSFSIPSDTRFIKYILTFSGSTDLNYFMPSPILSSVEFSELIGDSSGGGSSGDSGFPVWSDVEKEHILELVSPGYDNDLLNSYEFGYWIYSNDLLSDYSGNFALLHDAINRKYKSDFDFQNYLLTRLDAISVGGSDVNTNTGQGSVLWYLNRIEGYTSSTSADVGSALTEISSINGNLGDLKSNIISLYNEVQSNGGKLDLAVSALTSVSPFVPFGDSPEDTSSDPWSVAQWLRGIYFSIVGIFSPAQKELQDANEETISDVAKSGLVLSGSDVSSVDDFSGELVGVLDTGVNPLYGFGLISDGSLFGFFSVDVENDLLSTPSSGRSSGSGPLKAAPRGSPPFFDLSGLPKGIDEFEEENEILEDNLKEIEMDRGEG